MKVIEQDLARPDMATGLALRLGGPRTVFWYRVRDGSDTYQLYVTNLGEVFSLLEVPAAMTVGGDHGMSPEGELITGVDCPVPR
jgi:hypothetical protein